MTSLFFFSFPNRLPVVQTSPPRRHCAPRSPPSAGRSRNVASRWASRPGGLKTGRAFWWTKWWVLLVSKPTPKAEKNNHMFIVDVDVWTPKSRMLFRNMAKRDKKMVVHVNLEHQKWIQTLLNTPLHIFLKNGFSLCLWQLHLKTSSLERSEQNRREFFLRAYMAVVGIRREGPQGARVRGRRQGCLEVVFRLMKKSWFTSWLRKKLV